MNCIRCKNETDSRICPDCQEYIHELTNDSFNDMFGTKKEKRLTDEISRLKLRVYKLLYVLKVIKKSGSSFSRQIAETALSEDNDDYGSPNKN